MELFNEHVSVLTPTTVNFAKEVITNNEEAIFFVGRSSCPYCRLFASKLYEVVNETGTKIFFINSQEPSELDNLAAFRQQCDIKTVPGFVHAQNGKVAVRCDSSMSKEAIVSFMNEAL